MAFNQIDRYNGIGMPVFEYLKTVLEKEKCDYLYINHTNRFFSEYVDVSKSSRYLLTRFSGSTGEFMIV